MAYRFFAHSAIRGHRHRHHVVAIPLVLFLLGELQGLQRIARRSPITPRMRSAQRYVNVEVATHPRISTHEVHSGFRDLAVCVPLGKLGRLPLLINPSTT